MSEKLNVAYLNNGCDLIIVKESSSCTKVKSHKTVSFDEFKKFFRFPEILTTIFRYNCVGLAVYRWPVIKYPALTALLLRILSRKKPFIIESSGNIIQVDAVFLFFLFKRLIVDYLGLRKEIHNVIDDLYRLELTAPLRLPRVFDNAIQHNLFYLRTDLWFGLLSGGSVGHVTGVVNNFKYSFSDVQLITTDSIPLVDADVSIKPLELINRYWDFDELPSIFSSRYYVTNLQSEIYTTSNLVIYQRYSINNYTGAYLSVTNNIPFILEYNGSEVWIARNWGKTLKYVALTERIEEINLLAADVIVVVSNAMKDDLHKRNIDPDKILVNPNCVDSDRYSPEIDGHKVRKYYGLENKLVIGFIGTFGPWHGAEVLANAYVRLMQRLLTSKTNIHLLMIGDGVTLSNVRSIVAANGLDAFCTFTGVVPQESGPSYLAACDILASPHVSNPDGTPFFGSPTKLFEYMAMGKAIIASDLDQIGEVLTHDKTAWMVKPGDAEELATGLEYLLTDPSLRKRLGVASRAEVIEKYTWEKHAQRIVEKLNERLGV